MVTTISIIFFIYIVLKLYISVMQIGYIAQEKSKTPFLLPQDKFIEAGNYSIAKERLEIVSTIVEYGLFIFWMNDGFKLLDEYITTESATLKTLFFVFGFIFINSLLNFPIDIYQKFVIDKKFGFNKSTFGLYLVDTLKGLIIAVVIGTPTILGVAYFIDNAEYWWLWSFLIIFGIIIFANMLYPILIAPIFNKMTPLEDENLKREIEELLEKVGFKSSGIFSVDASRRDTRLNAYFGGFGSTKRVVLFDTLIEKLKPMELLAVLGHELGHFKHGDIYKNIGIMGFLLFVLFYILGHIPNQFFDALGIEKSSHLLISLFILFMPLFTMVIMPIFGFISRHNEFEADRVGSELSGNPIYLKEALKKLVVENRAFPKSHPIYIFFYYTHPPVADRLKRLEER